MANRVAEVGASDWPVEVIPGPDRLFYRVHRCLVPDGMIRPNVFRVQGSGMSVDWERYSTAAEARARARESNENGIIALVAERLRTMEGLDVVHKPLLKNRAHSQVVGMYGPPSLEPQQAKAFLTKVRVKLYSLFQEWEISPDQPVTSSER